MGSLAELMGDGSAWIYRNGKDCRIISPSLGKYCYVSVLLHLIDRRRALTDDETALMADIRGTSGGSCNV